MKTKKEFHAELLKKFRRGAKEHKQDWLKINPVPEIKDELLDVHNYSTLLRGETLWQRFFRWLIQKLTEVLWRVL